MEKLKYTFGNRLIRTVNLDINQDEWNNFLIDMWVAEQQMKKDTENGVTPQPTIGETVTIILTPDCHYPHKK